MGRSYRASTNGLEQAKTAFELRGWTQDYLAGGASCSRQTVSNFFARKPVDKSFFQAICNELGLEWGDVADLESEQLSTSMNATQHKNSELVQEPSGNTQVKSYAFAIAGTVSPEDIAKLKAIAALLKDLAQDTSIQIVDVERGSIKLILEGSQEGLERLENLFRSGQLEDVLGVSVEDVEFVTLPNSNSDQQRLAFTIAGDVAESEIAILKAALTETSDDTVQQFESQRLVSRDNPLRVNLILKNLIRGNFGGAFRILKNLSRANLSRANLSRADLSRANLEGAYLSGANLEGAYTPMLSTARTESLIVSTMIGMLTAIAQWLIKDENIRSIIIGCLLLGILLMLLLPQIDRLVRSYSTLASYRNFHERSHIEHQLMHQVRDMCLEMLVSVPPYTTPIPNPGCIPAPYPLLQQNRDKIITLLERVAQLFQLLVPPGTRVWACIRDRRADDCYYTFARAGRYNPNRSISSRPMHKDNSRTVQRLKDSLRFDGVCVLISGSNMGPQMWEPQHNDKYGEDKSVMLGAVLTKSWDDQKGDWSNKKLAWIIGVCADTENAFSETHIPLMQCCIDMFSMLVNVMIRST